MRLTPSIFAYSMLYPYTDNYLDDPSTSLAAKLEFSGRFRQRLEGYAIAALNEQEATIWRLVEIIEEEYPAMPGRKSMPGCWRFTRRKKTAFACCVSAPRRRMSTFSD